MHLGYAIMHNMDPMFTCGCNLREICKSSIFTKS